METGNLKKNQTQKIKNISKENNEGIMDYNDIDY